MPLLGSKYEDYRNPVFFILMLSVLFLAGCATQSGHILKVNPGDVKALQYMPDEISDVLEELGYSWVPLVDRETGRLVKMTSVYEEYRMRYQNPDQSVMIDVHIRNRDNVTGLHLKQTGNTGDGKSLNEQFQRLKRHLQEVFGQENVRESSALLTP